MNGLLLFNLPCSRVIFVVFVMCIAKHRCCWFLVISVFHLIIVFFHFISLVLCCVWANSFAMSSSLKAHLKSLLWSLAVGSEVLHHLMLSCDM